MHQNHRQKCCLLIVTDNKWPRPSISTPIFMLSWQSLPRVFSRGLCRSTFEFRRTFHISELFFLICVKLKIEQSLWSKESTLSFHSLSQVLPTPPPPALQWRGKRTHRRSSGEVFWLMTTKAMVPKENAPFKATTLRREEFYSLSSEGYVL